MWLIVRTSSKNTPVCHIDYVFADSYLWCIDSWIKTDQLDVTRFIISPFTAQHVSNVSNIVPVYVLNITEILYAGSDKDDTCLLVISHVEDTKKPRKYFKVMYIL